MTRYLIAIGTLFNAALGLGILSLIACSSVEKPIAVNENPLGCSQDRPICRVNDNPGGYVQDFVSAARQLMAQHRRLMITGQCSSACVIAADVARSVTCITPNASMRIHKVRVTQTRRIYYAGMNSFVIPVGVESEVEPPFSSDIRAWVDAHGGYKRAALHGADYLIMPYEDAAKIWRTCEEQF